MNTSACVEFSDLEGDDFLVELRSSDYRAVRRVCAYTDPRGIARIFREAANSWRGWSGVKTWCSIEGELTLSLKHDALGHVAMEVSVHHDSGNLDPWRLRAEIGLEAGQLERLASEAQRFFGSP